ncbi:unnamed protein product [Gordionus sp. m RMFG-2023]
MNIIFHLNSIDNLESDGSLDYYHPRNAKQNRSRQLDRGERLEEGRPLLEFSIANLAMLKLWPPQISQKKEIIWDDNDGGVVCQQQGGPCRSGGDCCSGCHCSSQHCRCYKRSDDESEQELYEGEIF